MRSALPALTWCQSKHGCGGGGGPGQAGQGAPLPPEQEGAIAARRRRAVARGRRGHPSDRCRCPSTDALRSWVAWFRGCRVQAGAARRVGSLPLVSASSVDCLLFRGVHTRVKAPIEEGKGGRTTPSPQLPRHVVHVAAAAAGRPTPAACPLGSHGSAAMGPLEPCLLQSGCGVMAGAGRASAGPPLSAGQRKVQRAQG